LLQQKSKLQFFFSESIDKDKIYVVGNTIVDAVQQNIRLVEKHNELTHYAAEKYILLTTHRPSNVDSPEALKSLLNGVETVAREMDLKVNFPIHPRTRKNLDTFSIKIDENIFNLLEPVGYLEMLALEKNAELIMTDSGGVQEEACILRIPSLTLRDSTERPETVEVGANVLVGVNSEKIVSEARTIISKQKVWSNPFGDGESGKRIVAVLEGIK
jgi:UDP-N-acetylglucosamine 2-epimerase (non-hydrolysing)